MKKQLEKSNLNNSIISLNVNEFANMILKKLMLKMKK